LIQQPACPERAELPADAAVVRDHGATERAVDDCHLAVPEPVTRELVPGQDPPGSDLNRKQICTAAGTERHVKRLGLLTVSLSLVSGGFVRADVSEPIAPDVSLIEQIDRAGDLVNRMLQTKAVPRSKGPASLARVNRATLVQLDRELNALRAVAASDLNSVGLQTLRARAVRAKQFCTALTSAEEPSKPIGTSGTNAATTANAGTTRIPVDRAQLRDLRVFVEAIVRLASDA
jgi:hypothetical protein